MIEAIVSQNDRESKQDSLLILPSSVGGLHLGAPRQGARGRWHEWIMRHGQNSGEQG